MSLPDNLPPGVTAPLQRMLAELGDDQFSIRDIIKYIERNRLKNLRIEKDDMPVRMTGYAVALSDCDLICTRHDLSTAQQLVTQLHEMSHFIRGDIPLLSIGEETTTYDQFIQKRDRHLASEARERFISMYHSPREHDTETMARILLQCIRKYEQNIPPVARQLYQGE